MKEANSTIWAVSFTLTFFWVINILKEANPQVKDSLNFYHTADASLEEVKYHLLLSKDLNYIDAQSYQNAVSLCEEVGKLLTRWIQSQTKYLVA